jgi:hypothetical protein
MDADEQIAKLEAEIEAVRVGSAKPGQLIGRNADGGNEAKAIRAQLAIIAGIVQSQAVLIATLVLLLEDAGLLSAENYTKMLGDALEGGLPSAATTIVTDLMESLGTAQAAGNRPRFEVIDGGLGSVNGVDEG